MALVSPRINDLPGGDNDDELDAELPELLGCGVSDDGTAAYDGVSSDQAGALCTDAEWKFPHEGLRVIKLATDVATRCWSTTTMP